VQHLKVLMTHGGQLFRLLHAQFRWGYPPPTLYAYFGGRYLPLTL